MYPKSSEEKMLQSISEELGVHNLLEILSTAPMNRLQPMLVHMFKNRSRTVKPVDLLRIYERKQELLGISSIAQDDIYKFALMCSEAVGTLFESVQTSPVVPFGLNSGITKVSQNNVLSSLRGLEVVSDLTSQLALECALRRKHDIVHGINDTINLTTSGHVLRLQPFDKDRGYTQHFNLFALCSGGRHLVSKGGFVIPALNKHISALLDVMSALHKAGHIFSNITVKVSDMRFLDQLITATNLPRKNILRNSLNDDFDMFAEYEVKFPKEVESADELEPTMFTENGLIDEVRYLSYIERSILTPLRATYTGIRFCFDFNRKSGLGYYPNLCFHIFATNKEGNVVQVADGGAVDWSAKLLSNKKEAMVISGIGSELTQKMFKK
ncbi:hypothetical protein CO173_01620 [Candidatus Uhrbacteria bacterium CG_4_9_14_3_um_filter_41_35]|uniref:Uncharacterized protein n=1 Tax=Candidatus Uhrbacteria bacterium CG_4_9_14_3_um_filter_41_35 TaxID=1975034 RepID=A0A2M7XEZ7_9BACT|nr:MAG: hypothetical protein CO173_01620 [Candidatus Uhrbacteria bacterium CG_4_9_14_3_um_filter_41_35]